MVTELTCSESDVIMFGTEEELLVEEEEVEEEEGEEEGEEEQGEEEGAEEVEEEEEEEEEAGEETAAGPPQQLTEKPTPEAGNGQVKSDRWVESGQGWEKDGAGI